MSVGSIELPLNWRYQPPMAYEDGTNFKLSDYVKENCGGLHELWASLKDSDGDIIATISVSNREITRSGYDLEWLHPVRFITQAEVNRIEASRLMEVPIGYYANSICPDTEAIIRKQWINNLLGIMDINCLFDENEDKWQAYRATFYNGEYSVGMLLEYNSAYAEHFEPLMQRVLNSIELGPYPPKIIDGVLSADGKLANLHVDSDLNRPVGLALPVDWVLVEADPVVLAVDYDQPLNADWVKPEAPGRPATFAELLPAGRGRIDMGKADYNFYAQSRAATGEVLADIALVFTVSDTMYAVWHPPAADGGFAYDSSAPARQGFDRAVVEELEGCVLSNWQEHGYLPFSKDLLHDSYLKTCGEAVYEVHTVKHGGEGNGPTFIFTGLFPADKAQEMRPVMDEIMDSIRPEL